PMLYAELGQQFDLPTGLKLEALFPDIFSYSWSGSYPWGGAKAEGQGVGEPKVASQTEQGAAQDVESGTPEKSPQSATPLLDKHKPKDTRGEVDGGPKLPASKDMAADAPADSVEGIKDIGANADFERAQEYLALAGHIHKLWKVVW